MAFPPRHHQIAARCGRDRACAPDLRHRARDLRAGDPSLPLYDRSRGGSDRQGRGLRHLRHQGAVRKRPQGAPGPHLKKAMWLAVELETLARQYYLSHAIGGPNILPDAEIEHVKEKFKAYG